MVQKAAYLSIIAKEQIIIATVPVGLAKKFIIGVALMALAA